MFLRKKSDIKENVFISLGSACDVAIFLNEMKLRRQSFPFDWLWNHYSGLEFITNSLKSEFRLLMDSKNYQIIKHYRYPNPVVTYKNYGQVAHIHSNPLLNKEDHLSLKKRYNRFLNELNSDSFKLFIYYRKFPEDIISGLAKDMEQSFELILSEGSNFIEQLLVAFPNIRNRFHLLLIIQFKPEQLKQAKELEKKFRQKLKCTPIVSMAIAPVRHPSNRYQHLKWSRKFLNIILKENSLNFLFKTKLYLTGLMNRHKLLVRLLVVDLRIWTLKKIIKIAKKLPFFE